MCVSLLTPTRTDLSLAKSEIRAGSTGWNGGCFGAFSHLDRMEAVLKRGGVSPPAHSVWTYVRTTIALLGETKHLIAQKRRPRLRSVPTLQRFVRGENTTGPATGTKSLGVFCLATGAKKKKKIVFQFDVFICTIWIRYFTSLLQLTCDSLCCFRHCPEPIPQCTSDHTWSRDVRAWGKPCDCERWPVMQCEHKTRGQREMFRVRNQPEIEAYSYIIYNIIFNFDLFCLCIR